MATVRFGTQGRTRAVDRVRASSGYRMNILRMNTIPTYVNDADPVMERTIIWDTQSTAYTRSTNTLPVKTEAGNSEYGGALLFPIAAGRRFSNMTLHLSDSEYSVLLTFVLEGAESEVVTHGAAKLVGRIEIGF